MLRNISGVASMRYADLAVTHLIQNNINTLTKLVL